MSLDYKQIGGGALGSMILAIMLMIGGQIELTDNSYLCINNNQTCEANFGISGGKHTRCYETQEQQDNWRQAPYCADGWIRIKDYVIQEEIPDEPIIKEMKGEKWICDSNLCNKIK